VVLGDIAVSVLAGLFVVVGFFWELAWLLALCLVVFVIVRKAMRHPHYQCIDCKREFTYHAIYGAK